MPPKSTDVRPRGYRFTARKRVPNPSSNVHAATRSLSSTPATDSASEIAGRCLLSPDIPASSECYQDAVPTPTSASIGALGKAPHSITGISPAQQSEGSEKTLGTDLGLVKPDTEFCCGGEDEKLGNSMEPENMDVEHLVSGKILHVPNATPSASGSGDGSKNSLPSVPEVRPQSEEECSVQPLTGPESAVPGKRKIVRKTVKKIVKKVIKKRVPKRVLSEHERTAVVTTLDEGKDISNAIEHLKFVNDSNLVERSNEVMEKAIVADEGTQELKLVDGTSVLEPIVDEKRDDPSGIDTMEAETSGFQYVESVPEQVVEERSDDQSGVNAMATNRQNIDAEDSAEVVKVKYPAETVMNIKEMETFVMENQSEVSFAGNLCMDVADDDERLSARQDVGPEDENEEVLVVEESERKLDRPDGGNSEMESDNNRLNELFLSGELEALERKKKRKTEVFVGGLDKYTNEDDIRKVFVEIAEVLEVRLVKSGHTGKNKGFAFVRFATAADAKKALENYSQVEILGKRCGVVPVEGNDTIFLGNIDRHWKTEDVVVMLEKAGIEKIDNVNLKIDPRNIRRNRGFAFVEFETCRDAQVALHKLQKKDAFGRNSTVKVEWAEPLAEPDEQDLLKVKAVYAEFLPSTWGEERVRRYFKKFGEIESVFLAKDIPSSRRKDFAFINYTTRDAAIACMEAINREKLKDSCSKVNNNIAVSLAKPIPKSKKMKHTSDLTIRVLPKAKPNGSQTSKKIHEPKSKWKPARSSNHNIEIDNEPSTTDELVQILRQQASSAGIPPHLRTARNIPDYDFPVPGSKRPHLVMPHEPIYVEPRVLPRARMENSYPISGPSSSSYAVHRLSFPYHQGRPGFASEPDNRRFYTNDFQTAEQDPYYGNANMYRRY